MRLFCQVFLSGRRIPENTWPVFCNQYCHSTHLWHFVMLNSVAVSMMLSYLSTTGVGPLLKHTLLLISYICDKYIAQLLQECIRKGIMVHICSLERWTPLASLNSEEKSVLNLLIFMVKFCRLYGNSNLCRISRSILLCSYTDIIQKQNWGMHAKTEMGISIWEELFIPPYDNYIV